LLSSETEGEEDKEALTSTDIANEFKRRRRFNKKYKQIM
jgi:hypothetical protein